MGGAFEDDRTSPTGSAASDETVAAVQTFGKVARRLAAAQGEQAVLDEIVRLAVEHLEACDFAGITFVTGNRVSSPASSSDAAATVDAIQAEVGEGPCLDAIRERDVFRTGDLAEEERWPSFARRAHDETGLRSIVSFRLFMEQDTLGSLNLYSRARDAFGATDVALGEVFASHAAVAMRSSRTDTEVLALQRSMLPPELPEVQGISMTARYLPATRGTNVGGDWYDALCLPDGLLVVTVGDVAGHGFAAATVMGQLRNALRAYTVAELAPAAAVRLASMLLTVVEPDAMATLCHLVVDARAYVSGDGDGVTLRWTNAGHPPPLLVGHNGAARFLTGHVDTPVGMGLPTTFRENTTTLRPGDLLLVYSDGLVERRGTSLADRLDRLAREAEGAPDDLDAFCDHLVERLAGATNDDDVGLLTLRVEHDGGDRRRPAQPPR